MSDVTLADLVERSLRPETRPEFEHRVDRQADRLRHAIQDGAFENDRFTIGLELEAYVVDTEGRLATVPDDIFETAPCAKELGRHNVELNTSPTAFGADGFAAGAVELETAVRETRSALDAHDLSLVLDGMWTIPPTEGSREYLSATDDKDGVTIVRNMRPAPRYVAIDREVIDWADGAVEISVPGAQLALPTILVESLTSSIQPHLQIPDREAFAAYYNVGIRTMAPVLALTANSPFLPADLYGARDHDQNGPRGYGGATPDTSLDPLADPESLLDATYHELRIPIFEQSINPGPDGRKVRFPGDLAATADVVDRLVDDRTCAPFLKEWVKGNEVIEGYADRIWELDHKRGTYWRWLRAVIGGEAIEGVSEESLRIEYRPIPTQPTVRETVSCQALVTGLVHGLVTADHPIRELDSETAEANFYRAVEAGLDADLTWVDATGARTTDLAAIFGECFEYARRGLRSQGLDESTIDEYLAPLEERWDQQVTPSVWKIDMVRDRLDAGASLREAIEGMQRNYIEQAGTGTIITDWSVTHG